MPELLEELAAHIGVVEFVDIVTEHLGDHDIIMVRISGSEETLDLFLAVYLRSVVRHRVEKLVAGSENQRERADQNKTYLFHISF